MTKSHPLTKATDLQKQLSHIFRDDSGAIPDLTKLERRPTHRLLFASVFGVVLLLFIVAAWLGFFVFKPLREFGGKGLLLSIDGPERVVIGEETTYFINWKNLATEPLASAEARVSFPVDFTPTSIDPKPTQEGMLWKFGSVGFGGRGTITIKGIFMGALGTNTAIQVVGTYRPVSFHSDFETLGTRRIEYAESVFVGSLAIPDTVLPGEKLRIPYTIQNRGKITMKGLEARFTFPPGFAREAATSTMALDGRVLRIPVGDLAAGTSTTITVGGSFASGHSGETTIHAELGRVGLDGRFQPAQKADATLLVLSGDLVLRIVANGSDTNQSVALSDTLRVAVGYENSAAEPITEVSIRVRFESLATTSTSMPGKKNPPTAFLDWTHLEDASSGTASGNEIAWNKKQVGVLERLPSGSDGSIEFSIPILRTASSTLPFQVIAEATIQSVGNTIVNRTIKSAPIVFRFRTDADVGVEARYFSEEGAPLGSGPLPPVAGHMTRYRIGWNVTKTIHELKNMRVTATLPKRVAWPNQVNVSSGDLVYDEAARTVTWSLDRVPADIHELNVTFDIDCTPSDFDIGRFANLLGETRFEVTDVEINELITRTKPPLTTDLKNDEGARSKGVVRKS